MDLTPEPALLFKIKSDIVFCVTRPTLFFTLPLPGGRGLSPPVGGGRAPSDPGCWQSSSGAGPSAGSPAPEAVPRGVMAALGRPWSVRLLVALRPLPARRPLYDAAPPRDVLLFEHERGRFFAVLGLFCAGQGVFWASLAVAALARPPARALRPDAEPADHDRLDLRSALWRYGLAIGCGAIGKAWAGFPPGDVGRLDTTHPAPARTDGAGLPTLRAGPGHAGVGGPRAKPWDRPRMRFASHSASLSSCTALDRLLVLKTGVCMKFVRKDEHKSRV